MTQRLNSSVYCPTCADSLILGEDECRCPSCSATYETREGIPILATDPDYYYDEISRDDMEWFLGIARSGRSLAEAFTQDDTDTPWEFILASHFDPTRAAWKLMHDLPQRGTGTKALDFGCGWGVNAVSLSSHYEEVVAMDLSWHRLLNLRLLADSKGMSNITVLCGGDTPHLPFPDAHFDLVALVGVIEWIPLGRDGPPRKVQVDFLREIRRITKPGGEVFLATENRYAYGYWTGRPDDHTGLLFGSLLPRFVSNLYSKLKRGRPYRNYTHSPAGYRKLVRDAGMGFNAQYGIAPAHRVTTKIFPITCGRIADADEGWGSTAKTALLRSRWARHLASAIGTRCGAQALRPGFLERLVAHVDSISLFPYRIETEPYRVVTTNFSAKAAVRFRDGGDGALLRVPLSKTKERLTANGVAEQKRWVDDGVVGPIVLEVAETVEFEGVAVGVESFFKSKPGGEVPGVGTDSITAILSRFAESRAEITLADLWATSPREAFVASLPQNQRKTLEGLLVQEVCGAVRCCYYHGDFHLENLLFNAEGDVRLIDWEWATPHGIPGTDAIHLIAKTAAMDLGTQYVEAIEALASGSLKGKFESVLGHVLAVSNLETGDLPRLAVVYLFDSAYQNWKSTESYYPAQPFINRNTRTLLRAAEKLSNSRGA